MIKASPQNIRSLAENEIFVFGSNTDGRHGKGAALTAFRKFGAVYGVGEGLTGKCYALPTVGRKLSKMSLSSIQAHVNRFLRVVQQHPEYTFLLTPVGCGLAGYKPKDIAPMFAPGIILSNILWPECFIPIVKTMSIPVTK